MRILRVIGRMNVGGPAQQIVNLEHGLSKLHYETRLLVGSPEQAEEDYLALYDLGLPRALVPHLRRNLSAKDFLALRDIYSNTRAFSPDVVHTHTGKAGLLGRLAAICAGTPYLVHTFHGHLLRGYYGPRGSKLVAGMERWLARRTTVLCAVGEKVRDELIQAGIGTKCQYEIVPPGITPPAVRTRAEARRKLNIPDDVPVVAYVGRMAPVKRPDRLLAVARAVFDARPESHFILAGGGELLAQTRTASQQLSGTVHILGWTNDVATVYAAADVSLVVSDNEGMPVSLIESSMAGTPAVTTNVGSAPEVVLDRQTGLVVPPDVRAIAGALLTILDNAPLRIGLGASAKVFAMRAFSVDRLVRRMDDIYQSLPDRSPR